MGGARHPTSAQEQRRITKPRGPKPQANASALGRLVREIGDEVIDRDTGWTRIEAVIRRIYQDALSGKAAQQELLLERGWGKVPASLDVDLRTEVSAMLSDSGLTPELAAQDPIMLALMQSAGYQFEDVYGNRNAKEPISKNEDGVDSEAGGGNRVDEVHDSEES